MGPWWPAADTMRAEPSPHRVVTLQPCARCQAEGRGEIPMGHRWACLLSVVRANGWPDKRPDFMQKDNPQ